jgi:hypothetical protein
LISFIFALLLWQISSVRALVDSSRQELGRGKKNMRDLSRLAEQDLLLRERDGDAMYADGDIDRIHHEDYIRQIVGEVRCDTVYAFDYGE